MKVARGSDESGAEGKERNDRARVRKKGRKGQEAGSDSLSQRRAARLFTTPRGFLFSDLGAIWDLGACRFILQVFRHKTLTITKETKHTARTCSKLDDSLPSFWCFSLWSCDTNRSSIARGVTHCTKRSTYFFFLFLLLARWRWRASACRGTPAAVPSRFQRRNRSPTRGPRAMPTNREPCAKKKLLLPRVNGATTTGETKS